MPDDQDSVDLEVEAAYREFVRQQVRLDDSNAAVSSVGKSSEHPLESVFAAALERQALNDKRIKVAACVGMVLVIVVLIVIYVLTPSANDVINSTAYPGQISTVVRT